MEFRKPRPKPPSGTGSVDATQEATKSQPEFNRMMKGAYGAGFAGDEGAVQSFPNTPMGKLLRREYERGVRARQAQEKRKKVQTSPRGLGFADMET